MRFTLHPPAAKTAPEGSHPFTTWCRRHELPYIRRRANLQAARNNLVSAFLTKLARTIPLELPQPEKQRLFDNRLAAASECDRRALCCRLTDAELDMLFADMLPSSGDENIDHEIAQAEARGEHTQQQEPDCGNPRCPVHGHGGKTQ